MEACREADGDITLSLSYAEAVVLQDVLSRWYQDGTWERLPLVDAAEDQVLGTLVHAFDQLIDEIFDGPAYTQLVAQSRTQLRSPDEPAGPAFRERWAALDRSQRRARSDPGIARRGLVALLDRLHRGR